MLQKYRFDVARIIRLILQWNARRGMPGGAMVQNRPGRARQQFAGLTGE
jgi:hypothetical protein